MLKNIFKSAKKLLKNPLVQLGIGAFLPGMLPASMGILRNPALVQAGIGLLGGDKPENVIRNLGITALLGGGSNVLQGGTFGEGVKAQFATPTTTQVQKGVPGSKEGLVDVTTKNPIQKVIEEATKGTLGGEAGTGEGGGIRNFLGKLEPSDVINALTLGVGLYGASQAPSLQDVNAQSIQGLLDKQKEYRDSLEASRFQKSGGIAGYAIGGKKTSIGINRETGEPSGMVTGPGTGKSDSIRFVSGGNKVPTDISNGEFIFTKRSVDEIGPDKLYALMNDADPESETKEEGDARMAVA